MPAVPRIREFDALSVLVERIVAASTVAATVIVLATANTPLDLWIISRPIGVAAACISALSSILVVFYPRDIRAMASCAGLTTMFWGLRALDLLSASVAGEGRLWTAAAVHALLATFISGFYRQAMLRHGFISALKSKERPDA